MPTFAVVGLGRFGHKLAVTLAEEGGDVIAVDQKAELVESVKDHVSVAVCLDATDEEALKMQGVDQVDTAIACIGQDFEANVLVTALLKQMGISRVYSRGSEGIQSRILHLVGADRVIHPEEDMALKLGQNLMIESIVDVIPLSGEYNVAEIQAPEPFWDQKVRDLELRGKYTINLIGIKERDENGEEKVLDSLPGADTVIRKGHTLIIVGKQKDIHRVANLE